MSTINYRSIGLPTFIQHINLSDQQEALNLYRVITGEYVPHKSLKPLTTPQARLNEWCRIDQQTSAWPSVTDDIETTDADALLAYLAENFINDPTGDLARAGHALADARESLADIREALAEEVRIAARAGMAEAKIAEIAGITRMTVRAMLGK